MIGAQGKRPDPRDVYGRFLRAGGVLSTADWVEMSEEERQAAMIERECIEVERAVLRRMDLADLLLALTRHDPKFLSAVVADVDASRKAGLRQPAPGDAGALRRQAMVEISAARIATRRGGPA